MSNWNPEQWVVFFTALGTLVGVILSAVAAFMSTLAKIKSEANSKKIDDNTTITRAGTTAAASSAKQAAAVAKEMNDSISKKLNGGLDVAIADGIKPLGKRVDELEKFTRAILDSIKTQDSKIEALLALAKSK